MPTTMTLVARRRRTHFDRNTMVLVLTWAASGVDAISYLGLGHVFTANMTGNAVLLGLAVGQGQGLAALRSIIALAGFVAGVIVGATVMENGSQRGEWPRAVTFAILVEGIILLLFTVAWHTVGSKGGPLYVLIVLSAVAMGIQSVAIRELKVPGVATTYITGTLTSMVAEFIHWLHGPKRSPLFADPTGQSAVLELPVRRRRGGPLQAAVVGVYVLAAVASGFLQLRGLRLVTFSPLLAVTFVLVSAWLAHRHE